MTEHELRIEALASALAAHGLNGQGVDDVEVVASAEEFYQFLVGNKGPDVEPENSNEVEQLNERNDT